jgi:hypothetical protein
MRRGAAPGAAVRAACRWATRRPGAARGLRGLAGAAPRRRCCYEVLGLPRDAKPEAVKLAYLRRAKAAHPDAATGSHEAFVELVLAYETLSAPALRSRYDAGQDEPGSADAPRHAARRRGWPWARGGEEEGGGVEGDEADDDETWSSFEAPYGGETGETWRQRARGRSHVARDAHAPFVAGWSASDLEVMRRGMGFLESIHAEFHEALWFAAQGPRVPYFLEEGKSLGGVMFPWAFECELRSDPSHAHIVELVSGQQLLGWVKLADRGARLTSGGQQAPRSEALELELVYQGLLVARAVQSADGAYVHLYGVDLDKLGRAPENPPYSSSSSSSSQQQQQQRQQHSQQQQQQQQLQHSQQHQQEQEKQERQRQQQGHGLPPMHLLCSIRCDPEAETGWLRRMGAEASGVLMSAFSARAQGWNFAQASATQAVDEEATARCRDGLRSLRVTARPKVLRIADADGTERYRAVLFQSLGVQFTYWFHGEVDVKLGFKMARCDAVASKAFLPPPSFWLFQPRSRAHSGSAWYIEAARPRIDLDELVDLTQGLMQKADSELAERAAGSSLARSTALQWAVELALAKKRTDAKAIDTRVPVLFAALTALVSEREP